MARLLSPAFASAWVGSINLHEKEAELRRLYAERGWKKYLLPAHTENVRAALREAKLL